jgi:hypothetical protein
MKWRASISYYNYYSYERNPAGHCDDNETSATAETVDSDCIGYSPFWR